MRPSKFQERDVNPIASLPFPIPSISAGGPLTFHSSKFTSCLYPGRISGLLTCDVVTSRLTHLLGSGGGFKIETLVCQPHSDVHGLHFPLFFFFLGEGFHSTVLFRIELSNFFYSLFFSFCFRPWLDGGSEGWRAGLWMWMWRACRMSMQELGSLWTELNEVMVRIYFASAWGFRGVLR